MRGRLIAVVGFVLLLGQVVVGYPWKLYQYFEITNETPAKIKIWVSDNVESVPYSLAPIVIEDSRFCEYIMATLINYQQLRGTSGAEYYSAVYVYPSDGFTFYQFSYCYTSSGGHEHNLHSVAIGANSTGNVRLIVRVAKDESKPMTSATEETDLHPHSFTLLSNATSAEKLKFDYLVSALTTYKDMDYSEGIVFDNNGTVFHIKRNNARKDILP